MGLLDTERKDSEAANGEPSRTSIDELPQRASCKSASMVFGPLRWIQSVMTSLVC